MDVQRRAKDALKAAGQLGTKDASPDVEKQDLGDPSESDNTNDSTLSAVPTSNNDNEEIKKLDAMATKLKASEHKTESNMQEIEHSYEKEQFKAEASAASKLADQDAPGELGESADDLP